MTWRLWIPLGVAAALTAVAPADAQAVLSKRPDLKVEVPRSLRPPPGMCRVWVEQVPASQQPAPTDCATAIRNRPPNGRVIFAEEQSPAAKPKDGASKSEASKGGSPKETKKPGERPPRAP
jgi:hypothetical protein